jgi:hypothetical protein
MKVIMKNLKRIWLAATMACIVTAGVFAQDQRNGQKPQPPPPKKEHPLVDVRDKKPPQNDGGKKGGDDKRGKP